MGIVAGAIAGGLFFFWIAGTRVIDPTEYAWLMKLDWRINFLGWHLFRNDPWGLPPGTIAGYLAGEGTTIGFTDSIPVAAMTFKLFDAWLPTPFQYFGLWLLLCFALQGAGGALITRVWTGNRLLQALGAMLFVTAPTLLIRVGHPALTAHFLLLGALWLYVARNESATTSRWPFLLVGFLAGMTHPYLAAMTLAILVAVPLRDRTRRSLVSCTLAIAATVAAWWLAGFISVSATTDLSAGGLGLYSMNALSPITPLGWSTIMPDLPVAHEFQAYEGFQYLGIGAMLLLVVALVIAVTKRGSPVLVAAPLVLVCVLAALYAVSPRVTVGREVIADWSSPAIDRLAFFRASGRFFWPMTYLLLTVSIALVVARLRATVAATVLALAIVLQFVDQRNAHGERRVTSRSEAFHSWSRQLVSPAWHDILPYYDHIVLAPAAQCGGAPLAHEELAYLAGLHGLTINSGLGARWDETRRRRHCGELEALMAKGLIEDQSIYVVSAAHEQQLRGAGAVVCGGIDTARVCVTAASFERWRDRVQLSE